MSDDDSRLDAARFDDVLRGLRNGDFSRLAPHFESTGETPSTISRWVRAGRFQNEAAALAEAFSCACFNGFVAVAQELLDAGADPLAGNGTGMDAFHWAVNRGQLAVVEMLIARGVSMATVSMHDTTLLDTALWSEVHEPKPDHARIVALLRVAGAK